MKIQEAILKVTFVFFLLLNVKLSLATVINIPADFITIQEGIDNSTNGDTVLVHPGTYVENLTISGKNIVLASLYFIMGDTSYISQTIIDGSYSGNTIRLLSNSSSLIEGLTIINGGVVNMYISVYGGNIYCNG